MKTLEILTQNIDTISDMVLDFDSQECITTLISDIESKFGISDRFNEVYNFLKDNSLINK